ncbi:unnamed protein product [Medioppia subpectinata]|uniref:non-specific serine/threonine protein kinase n=1 Tax=Medioppia subpectinata TaxID=1979941 RepID=A0A7R9L8Q0_9ACAR|nr:unnamed protein product [Medioppia subpectinata]CAG2116915.1 unnamed protein product [Medioppia subpectinata]
MFAPTITAMNRLIGRTDSPSAHVTQPKAPEDVDINQGYYVHSTKLGEGGFGTVRLATHYKTNQKVAIKKMNKLKLGGDLFRVKTEISALKVLNHDNIAQLLQVIETQDTIYLVLEVTDPYILVIEC